MRLFVREDAIWIVVDAGQAEPVATALARFAIMDDFAAAPRPDFAFSSLLGPAAAARLAAIGVRSRARSRPRRCSPTPRCATDAGRASGSPACASSARDGFWLGAPPPVLAAIHARLAAAGVPELEPAAAEAARIAAVEPRFGAEITAGLLPDGGRAWTPRSTTPRAAISVRSRSCASATAATSTGGWSAWTWPARAIPPRCDRDRKRRQAEGRAGDQRGPPARRPRRRAGDASHQHRRGRDRPHPPRRGAHRRAGPGRTPDASASLTDPTVDYAGSTFGPCAPPRRRGAPGRSAG